MSVVAVKKGEENAVLLVKMCDDLSENGSASLRASQPDNVPCMAAKVGGAVQLSPGESDHGQAR